MLDFLKKKTSNGSKVVFKIDGMHCSSCSMNIDAELEDTPGVVSAHTSYAKAETTVEYLPNKVDEDTLKQVIESLEYQVLS